MSEKGEQAAPNRERAERATLSLWELAYQKGAPAIYKVRKLIAKGADIHAPMPPSLSRSRWLDDYQLVHIAAHHNHYHLMKPLLKAGVWVDQPTTMGTTPLMVAASYGYAEMVALLLAHSASPLWEEHSQSRSSPESALSKAILFDHSEAAIALIDAGAPVDFTTPDIIDPRLPIDHLKELLSQTTMVGSDGVLDAWRYYELLWQQAEAWAVSPDISQMTPHLVCALSNIGKLEVLYNAALWRGHEAELMALLTNLPPWLAETIASQPMIAECVMAAPAPTTCVAQAQREASVQSSLRERG